MLKSGTVVDATLILALSSTKNSSGTRDPERHQTKKGNQWHFGMKAPIGVAAESGLVQSVIGTAANVNDVTQGKPSHPSRHETSRAAHLPAPRHSATSRPAAVPTELARRRLDPGSRPG